MVLVLETPSPFTYSWGGGWLHKKRVIPGGGGGGGGNPSGSLSLYLSLSLSLYGESVKGNLSILVSIHGVDFFFHYAIEGDLANMNNFFFFFK